MQDNANVALTIPGVTGEPLFLHTCNVPGSESSPWVDIRTLEASPAHLADFTVEQREQGRALLLSWDQPRTPNGVITVRIRL